MKYATPARGSIPGSPIKSSMPSKRPRRAASGWDFRSVARSWKITMDSSGQQLTKALEPPFTSLFQTIRCQKTFETEWLSTFWQQLFVNL